MMNQVTLCADAFVTAYGRTWHFDTEKKAHLKLKGGIVIDFDTARVIEKTEFESGLGKGVRTLYHGFKG